MNRVPSISRALRDAVEHGVFPGGVLLVRRQGEVLHHEAVGCRGMPPYDQPVTLDTVYDLASLTKPLATTTAVLSLVQSGRLHIEDPIADWVESLRKSPFASSTIGQLLNHSAGFPSWKPYYQYLAPAANPPENPKEREARIEACLALIAQEPLAYGPGRTSLYSDLGFIVLGVIVEKSTGQNLAAYCRNRIFDPLRMADCSYLSDEETTVDPARIAPTEEDAWRGRMVHGEVHDENAFALGGMAGHAGLFGTAESVSRLTYEWLQGVHGHSSVLSSELVHEWVTRQAPTGQSSWALGWDTPSAPSSSGQYFSRQSFGHLGFAGTSIWIVPEHDIEVILLSNRVHPTRKNTKIQQFRPLLHDAVCKEAGRVDG